MSNLRLVPAGSTVTRTYLAIPGHYGTHEGEFENTDAGWDAAVTAAQAKRADLIASLSESIGAYSTPEQIEQTADVQVRIDLRWVIAYDRDVDPAGLGGSMDTVIESYKQVDRLRVGVRSQGA